MKCTRMLASALALAASVVAVPMGAAVTHAATSDLVGTVTFSQDCSFPLGAGVTFDGKNLWYSCDNSSPDLYRADPTTGQVTASYNVAGGLGALAYDAGRNAIWAGFGVGTGGGGMSDPNYVPGAGDIILIPLDSNKNAVVSSATLKVTASDADVSNCSPAPIDGLAYDASNDSLYIAPECSSTIYRYSTSGNELGTLSWYGGNDPTCNGSAGGLAVGGSALLEASNQCNTIWAVDKNTGNLLYNFSTAVSGDPNSRGLGLTCDDTTFGKDVVWSKEASSPMRAHAFEIPAGSCVPGGGSAQVATKISYTGATSGDYDDASTLSATLTTASGSAVANAPVTFYVGSQHCAGTTNSSGSASCSMTLSQRAGSYTLSASYAGDASHAGSGTTGSFTVNQEETTLTPSSGTLNIVHFGPATLQSTLTEDGSAPISGRPVVMTLGGVTGSQSCTGFTNNAGVARCTINSVTLALGPQAVTATFSGDNFYKASSDPDTAIVYANLSSGTFVLGDKSATMNAAVTFWGARWARQNSFSGGAAPMGHFGFADQVSSKPITCGSTWTMKPGMSARPPATVPSYMAVAVSSSVTRSGGSTTGKVARVVIVKVNSTSMSSPGSAGTGKVVGVVC